MTKSIDMDKTIQKSLNNLANYLSGIITKEQQKISTLKNERDRLDKQELNKKQLKSLEFLKQVAKNPKRYFYTEKDWIYNECEDGETVYQKLESLTYNNLPHISRNTLEIIARLCHEHFNNLFSKKSELWIIYSHENVSNDTSKFLENNKRLALLNGPRVIKKIQQSLDIANFIPTKLFTIDR